MTDTHQRNGLTGAMFIGASRVAGTGEQIHATDPHTGERLEPAFGFGTADDVTRAVTLASEAFPAYRATTPEARAAFLRTIADNIDATTDTLVPRVVAETGIVEPRVRGELGRTTGQLRLFAKVVRSGLWTGVRIDTPLPDRKPLPRPDIRQRKVPVGPVAVFGASNFPLAFSVAGGDTASALAAGCPVVVKAHPSHPGTSEIVAGALAAAVAEHGLPEGVFSLLHGSPEGVAIPLVTAPEIAAVGFTGSRGAGTALMAAAAARPVPIPVYAEMSSVNPVFVLPAALEANAARLGEAFVASLTMGVGQLCTNPGLVFVADGPGLDTFLEAAASGVQASAAAPMLSSGIHSAYGAGVGRLRDHADVEEVATGLTDDQIAAAGQTALFTTSGNAFLADKDLQEENFGASSLVVRLKSADQAAAVVEVLEGQLTATLHAEPADYDTAGRLLPLLELKAGRILFNGWPTGVDVGTAMVHGGPYPATSDGRSTSVGTAAIDRFLRPVAYQNLPADLLPAELDTDNSLGLWRQVDGELVQR